MSGYTIVNLVHIHVLYLDAEAKRFHDGVGKRTSAVQALIKPGKAQELGEAWGAELQGGHQGHLYMGKCGTDVGERNTDKSHNTSCMLAHVATD